MIDFEKEVFLGKAAIKEKLLQYGFSNFGGIFSLEKQFFNNQFIAKINVVNNVVTSKIIEVESGEEYALLKIEKAKGNFVGEVRKAYIDLLNDIAIKCFSKTSFGSTQADKVNSYIVNKYKVQPDFPWEKFPSFCVYRNQENNLWFAFMGVVEDGKLSKEAKGCAFINIKPPKEMVEILIKQNGIYPGWHMNKKTWISIRLDDTFEDKYIFDLIDLSYLETFGKEKVRLFPPKRKVG